MYQLAGTGLLLPLNNLFTMNYSLSNQKGILFSVRFLTPVLFILFFISRSYGQGYIEHSRVIGSTAAQTTTELIVDGGYSYILGTTGGNDYPVTLGGAPTSGPGKSTLTKLDHQGNIVWSRYMPFPLSGLPSNIFTKMVLSNNVLFLLGSTNNTNVPTTNGTVGGGGGVDILFTKIDPGNGNLLHNGYLGGNGLDGRGDGVDLDLAVENGYAYITYLTSSSNIPVTAGQAFTLGYDRVIQKLDGSGNIVYSILTGRVNNASTILEVSSLKVESGIVTLAANIGATNNFITTDGSTHAGTNDIGIVRLDASGNKVFSKLLGGSTSDVNPVLAVNNGDIYLAAATQSTNYPVTDGSSRASNGHGIVLTKINSSGNLVFSGYRTGVNNITVGNVKPVIKFKNGSVYLSAYTASGTPTLPSTDGSAGSTILMKIDGTNGSLQFAVKSGQQRSSPGIGGFDMYIDDNGIYTTSPVVTMNNGATYVTDGTVQKSGFDIFVAKHSLSGQLLFGSILSPGSNVTFQVATENGKLYVSGAMLGGLAFPVTQAAAGTLNNSDLTWTEYAFCPAVPTNNAISPLTQNICQGGLVQGLTGDQVIFPSSLVPVIYINGVATEQTEIHPRYQWQSSTSATGPWVNIMAGTQKDYLPPTAAQTLYYRRLVLPPLGCGETPVSISPVAEIVVGANASPTVTNTIFNTCAGTGVNISLTANGGISPYTYSWDNGISSTTNAATVTPTANSVYTLTVTDANGCQQIGQAIVNAYTADAGPATATVCAGSPVRIGAAPPAGLNGVIYSWSPTTGLDDPTAAQPLATPTITTVYTLQMTVPISGGGTCTTNDNITVNVQAGPATANFAGANQATCKGGSLSLGTVAEGGITYTWTPGSYLSTVTTSTTTFNAGTNLPSSNPMIYTLTAAINGCTFTDQVQVAVLDVDAGDDYCGPRTVGTADKMPAIAGKTWLWEVVSGPGSITGATNTPTTTVSASATTTTYRVTVSYLGTSCSDLVIVDPCGPGACPTVEIDTIAVAGCPSTVLGGVSLRANPSNLDPAQWAYAWSSVPAGGLSTTTGNLVTLTDNIERDVTLTITRIDNPSVSCSHTIHVNDPSWSLPVFSAPDQTVCSSTPVSIGTTPVAGYLYTWQNVSAGDVNAFNPSVSPTVTTEYPVMVQDIGSGCLLLDTVKVNVKPLIVDPGSDWIACSNALVTLGSPAQPGYTYSWNPQVASYQNSTTYQSAMPQLLIATTQDFTLTVTDTETGCTDDSTVHITIDGSNTLPPMTNPTICAGGSATIGLPVMTGVTYSWSPSSGLSSTTVAQPVASPTSTQVYTLSITYYDAGGAPACTKTGSVTVFVQSPQITISDEAICPSGPLYNLSNGVTVTGATSYSWSPAILVTSPTTLSTTVNTNPSVPTTFILTATDASGCVSTASKLVSPINAAPEAGSSGFVCVGDSKTLGNSANSGILSWTVSPAIAGTLSPANGAEPVFTPAAADAGQTFTFTITQDIGGCINTDVVNVPVRSLVLPTMTAQTVCMNSSATIGVAPEQQVSYSWTPVTGLADPNAATTTVDNVTGTTVYTLTATDNFGCSATANAAVGVNPVAAPTVTIPDVTALYGSSGVPFLPQVSPMPADYTYNWTPGNQVNNPYIANATAIPAQVGTYTYNLEVTDENGCTSTALARLNVIQSSTLPVTLSSFTAIANACGVRLNWKVESVERFSAFVVERKGSGGGYKEINVIYHDPSRSQYKFDDVDPGNGDWAYRLRLVDQDGQFRYSSTVFAPVNCTAGEKLVIYPNPVNNHISIKSSKAVSSLTVLSITGQIMIKKEYRQTQPGLIVMPIEKQLPQGIYFLQVRASDGTTQNIKLIKE
jgi:hypothetical protein